MPCLTLMQSFILLIPIIFFVFLLVILSFYFLNIMSQVKPINVESATVKQQEPTTTTSTQKKTRQSKSDVWNDFTKIEVNGITKAKCKHCGVEYMARPKDGTNNLIHHLKLKHPSKVKQDAHPM